MKIAGCFDEFWPPTLNLVGSIRQFVTGAGPADEAKICTYLRSGDFALATMGVTGDIFGSDEVVIGGASILTDGEWIWRGDLQFYVSRYHVELPDEFKERIRGTKYSVPKVSSNDMSRLIGEVSAIRSWQPKSPSRAHGAHNDNRPSEWQSLGRSGFR